MRSGAKQRGKHITLRPLLLNFCDCIFERGKVGGRRRCGCRSTELLLPCCLQVAGNSRRQRRTLDRRTGGSFAHARDLFVEVVLQPIELLFNRPEPLVQKSFDRLQKTVF